jgi:hypothetical protein
MMDICRGKNCRDGLVRDQSATNPSVAFGWGMNIYHNALPVPVLAQHVFSYTYMVIAALRFVPV